MEDSIPATCAFCGRSIPWLRLKHARRLNEQPSFCSNAHRQAHYRARIARARKRNPS